MPKFAKICQNLIYTRGLFGYFAFFLIDNIIFHPFPYSIVVFLIIWLAFLCVSCTNMKWEIWNKTNMNEEEINNCHLGNLILLYIVLQVRSATSCLNVRRSLLNVRRSLLWISRLQLSGFLAVRQDHCSSLIPIRWGFAWNPRTAPIRTIGAAAPRVTSALFVWPLTGRGIWLWSTRECTITIQRWWRRQLWPNKKRPLTTLLLIQLLLLVLPSKIWRRQ